MEQSLFLGEVEKVNISCDLNQKTTFCKILFMISTCLHNTKVSVLSTASLIRDLGTDFSWGLLQRRTRRGAHLQTSAQARENENVQRRSTAFRGAILSYTL